MKTDVGNEAESLSDDQLRYDASTQSTSKLVVEPQRERYLTMYERLSYELANDRKCQKEITLGKRIGFYRLRGQLGSGNFSQVKLGVHILTKG